MESDSVYFSRRAKEERAAASIASHPTARQSHDAMADRYEEMASAISSHLGMLGSRQAAVG